MKKAAWGLGFVILAGTTGWLVGSAVRTSQAPPQPPPAAADSRPQPATQVAQAERSPAGSLPPQKRECKVCTTVPKFVKGGSAMEALSKLPQEWPNPPTKETVDRVESARRAKRDELVKAAQLSAAEQGQLDAIVTSMNKKIEEIFDRLVAPKLREREPLPDEDRMAFLTEMSSAVQAADQAVAKLTPEAGTATQATSFLAATQMDAENALRVATFYARYVHGSPIANGTPLRGPE
jgi:hypothetical protein